MSASRLARKRAGQFTTETARKAGRISGERRRQQAGENAWQEFALLVAIGAQIDKQANRLARKYDRLAG